MSTTLTVRDTTMSGETLNECCLEFLTERITVRELIRSRVYQEVQDYNLRQPERFCGLIQPEPNESALNGPRSLAPRQINWQRQLERALTAFNKQQVLILVQDRQVHDLDEEIEIKPGTDVSFLRLTMLTGG
jgi:hypothetical protein